MNPRRSLLSLLGLLGVVSVAPLTAVDIPLQKGGDKGTRVGFVDMDKIFREYPDTLKARGEYYKELERRKQAVAEKERQLALLDAPLEVAPAPAVSTAPAVPVSEVAGGTTPVATVVPVDTVARDAEKEKLKTELAAARQEAIRSLKEFEEKRSLQILGTLYKALAQLAEERGVDVVVDKTSLLYGQPAVDLTDALSRRVRGLPEGAP